MAVSTEDRPRRGLSLEQKIPLLITALLVTLLSLTVAVAHREVESSARVAGDERLERMAIQLSEIVQNAVLQRMSLVREVATHEHVRAVLAGRSAPDDSILDELLGPLAALDDETSRVELLDPSADQECSRILGTLAAEGGLRPSQRDQAQSALQAL